MTGDGGTLESQHGINQHLRSKLEGAGVQSIVVVQIFIPMSFSVLQGKHLH
jgi:hypothetical protein